MKAFTLTVCLIFSFFAFAQVHVNGYYRSNGTYVAPYTRSSPNSTPVDNYSYPGNTNPYTGKTAIGNPDTYIKNQNKSTTSTSTSDVWVDGYYRSDGTYVQGYYRSAPDGNPYNNYSFPGNTNPHTGKTATGNADTYLQNYFDDPTYSSGLTYHVSSNTLNVRSGPSTSNLVLISLNKGDDLEVLESVSHKWIKVKAYGITGYVYSSYISFTNPVSTYFNSSLSINNSASPISSNATAKNINIDEIVDTSRASKDNTKGWILSKLQRYTSDKYYYNPSSILGGSPFNSSGSYLENFFFYFDEYNLIVEYQEELSSSKIEKRELSIPVYNIAKVYDYNNEIVFMTKNETMIDRNITTNKQNTKNYFSVEFNVNAETDLCERLLRAFVHLKKFYKKPVSSEAF